MTTEMVAFLLIAFHFVCDYSLQSDFIAVGKNPNNPTTNGVPWYWIMWSHCFVHGAAVALITNSVILGAGEVLIHFVIDMSKCKKLINADVDQIAHLLCKLVWIGVYCYQWGWSYVR